MGKSILVDDRWIGRHGIARFADEVIARLGPVERVSDALRSPPLHPLDSFRLARDIRRRKPSLFFSPGFNPPQSIPCPLVFCIFDLVHLDVADERTRLKSAYYRLIVKPATRRAAAIVTTSEFSRQRILARFGLAPEKVVVTGCGVGGAFRRAGPRHAAPRPYLLYVGNHKPHKNTERMLLAWSRSRARRDCDLVLVASPTAAAYEQAKGLGIFDALRWVHDIEDEELAALYRGARGLLLPSLVEGFGLPVVEAMACGTPSLIGNAASLSEVAAKAALGVDPTDTDAIAAGIDQLVEDESLRSELIHRGLARAAEFDWDRVTDRVRRVLDGALGASASAAGSASTAMAPSAAMPVSAGAASVASRSGESERAQ